ncbi:MAG: formyl transferase, partial [Methylococcales bacterium]|nr:formyl transferase [Methylococcales bacterium]
MRIVFIGCVQFSYEMIQHLLTLKNLNIVGIITRRQSTFNADFYSLESIAEKNYIPCFIDENNNQSDMAQWLKPLSVDMMYCLGWSYLLTEDILSIPKQGSIGYHPAYLPKNRGRHPLIWALALGLTKTASTFFLINNEADAGDIINQQEISITHQDDATTLYQKMINTAKQQLSTLTPLLVSGHFKTIPQDHNNSNYWRKRSKKDGEIDWRMSSKNIYNLVRALTRPYVGAHCIYLGSEIKIWRAIKNNQCAPYNNIEPGKI